MQRKNFLFTAGIFCLLFDYSISAQAQNTTTQSQNTAAQAQNSMTALSLTDTIYNPIVYSLQQCVDSALKNNPTVKTTFFTSETAKINYDQQRSTMLPSINAYGNYLNNGGKSVNPTTYTYINENYNSGYYQAQATLVLWNGFSIQNFIRQYALNYQATQMDYQQAKDLMTVNVILAYLTVLSNEEQLTMAKAQAEATRGKVKLLELENAEGAITPSTLSDMKGQLGTDELSVVTTQNTLETNKLALAQFMNIPYTPNLEFQQLSANNLTPVMYDATVDQIYQNAAQNLAQVKAANLHLASAVKGVKANFGNMLPSLSFYALAYSNYSTAATSQSYINTTTVPTKSYVNVNGGQSFVYSPQDNYSLPQAIPFGTQFKNDEYYQLGLQLNIPILQGFRLRTPYRQAKINLEQAKFNASTTMIQLKQSVESYYVTMMNAFRTYNTLAQQVKDYEESFRAAEIRFNAGSVSVLTSLDYLTAKNNIDHATISLIQAKYNYILQTKILDYFQGKLTW